VEQRAADPKRPASRWRELLCTQEAAIFLVGLASAGAIIAWFVFLAATRPEDAATILAVLPTHLSGGRAFGVTTALSRGFTRREAMVLGSLIEVTVVCFFFPAFSLSFKKLLKVGILEGFIANIYYSARQHRKRIMKWGIAGLMLFVWFPLFMTGPVVGSVIGFLMGLPPWLVTLVVLVATVVAIITWTFAIAPVVARVQVLGEVFLVTAGLAVLATVIWYRVKLHREDALQREKEEKAAAKGTASGAIPDQETP
jgi:uncharacterized membrane protein